MDNFKVGDIFIHEFSITQEQVVLFAQVSGDHNPIHLDADFASTTIFKKPIIHGMFGASIISFVMGMKFPGPGSIYLKQSLEFLRPMYTDVAYEGIFKVLAIDEKNRATVETNIIDKTTKKVCTKGEATILLSAKS